jgi:hypothetical protein
MDKATDLLKNFDQSSQGLPEALSNFLGRLRVGNTAADDVGLTAFIAGSSIAGELGLNDALVSVFEGSYHVVTKAGISVSGKVSSGPKQKDAVIYFNDVGVNVLIDDDSIYSPDIDLELALQTILEAKVLLNQHIDAMYHWPREQRINALEKIAKDAGVSRTFINFLALTS